MSGVSVFAGLVTRSWRCGPALTVVSLTHNTITGGISLTVDGEEVPLVIERFHALTPPTSLAFNVAGKSGSVTVQRVSQMILYKCVYDGGEMQEENSLASSSTVDADAGKLKVTIEGVDHAVDNMGKAVVWYRISSLRLADERATVVHRRFSEFFAANEAIRAAYKGSHLLAGFPELPPRTLSWFSQQNTNDPAFLEARRWKLHDWLYKMEQIPRMRQNPDFCAFVGLVDSVREVSVVFRSPGLGLQLRDLGPMTEVVGVKPLGDGSPSPAEGILALGDKISKINGEDVVGTLHDVLVTTLKVIPRPTVIHFLGEARPGTLGGSSNAAAASSGSSASAAAPAAPATPSSAAYMSSPAPVSAPAVATDAPMFSGSAGTPAATAAASTAAAATPAETAPAVTSVDLFGSVAMASPAAPALASQGSSGSLFGAI